MSSGSAQPSQVVLHLLAAVRSLNNEMDLMDEAVAAHLGVHQTDWRAVDLLAERHPTTAGQLAEILGLSMGAITGVVDRLERAGLARREVDAADRRRVRIEVTNEARLRLDGVFAGLLEASTRLLQTRYSDEQLATIDDFVDQLRALVTKHTGAIRQRRTAANAGYATRRRNGSALGD